MDEPVRLKYLFLAEFTDGTIFEQAAHDKSSLDPKRSQFYDLLQSEKTIRRFSLVGDGQKVSVDLATGLFDINGLAVILETEKLPTLPDKFNLIFYRQWTQTLDVTYATKTGNIESTDNPTSFCEYFIGWECDIAGKHYKQKIGIA